LHLWDLDPLSDGGQIGELSRSGTQKTRNNT
jgi:hypothetical protein